MQLSKILLAGSALLSCGFAQSKLRISESDSVDTEFYRYVWSLTTP